MLPTKYRRLWRRRLRRRPLVPFLVAATLAVDLVLFRSEFLYGHAGLGFLAAQSALLSIWITDSRRGWASRSCITLLLLLGGFYLLGLLPRNATSKGPSTLFEDIARAMVTGFMAVQAGSLLAAGACRAAIRWHRRRRLWPSRRRFSIGHLLVLAVLIALCSTISRYGYWSVLTESDMLTTLVGESLVAPIPLALALLLQGGRPRFVALVIAPLAAMGVGWVILPDAIRPTFHLFVNGVTLSIWLYLANVGQRRPLSVATRRAKTAEPTSIPKIEPSIDVTA